MDRRSGLILLMLLGGLSAGCQHPNFTAADRYERGLVVCLSGAGGVTGEVDRIRQGLNDGGVDYALEAFKWSRHNVLDDQTDMAENRLKAGQLARRIEAYQLAYPYRPVYLIGVSAGTGLVVWALEELQPGHRASGVILISSSLDRRYDLSRALGKIDQRLYNFHNPLDPILVVGVQLAGTVDRQGGPGGGLHGFESPEEAGPYTRQLYQSKLSQYRWKLDDLWKGHTGGHLGATNRGFVRHRMAPLLLGQGMELRAKD